MKTYPCSVSSLARALLLISSGCTLSNLDLEECASDEPCVTAFGPGAVCRADGFCEPAGECTSNQECRDWVGFGSRCEMGACVDVEPDPRCTLAMPEDLWTNLDEHRDRIVFGSLAERSEAPHAAREQSMDLAAKIINASGGVDGRAFGIVHCDVQGGADNPYGDALERPEAVIATTSWFVDQLGVPAVMGPMSSEDTQQVYTEVIAPAAPTTMVMSPSASGASLAGLDTVDATDEAPGLLWRTAPSSGPQGTAIAEDLATRSPPASTNVAIIRENGSLGEGTAGPFVEAWSELGGASTQFVFENGNEASRIEQIALVGSMASSFQAVVFLGQVGDCRAFVSQATDSPEYRDDLFIYFVQGGANADVFADASDSRLFTRIRAVGPALPSGFIYQNFRDAFTAEYGQDPGEFTFTAHSYDAMWLVAMGSVWALANEDVLDGQTIARGVRHLARGGVDVPLTESGWSVGLLQLRAGERIDVEGASGVLDFDAKTEETTGPLQLVEGTIDGTYVPVVGS